MVNPNLKGKRCMSHIGGDQVKRSQDNLAQACTKCSKWYTLEDKYSHGCTLAEHIFDEEMDKRIRTRNLSVTVFDNFALGPMYGDDDTVDLAEEEVITRAATTAEEIDERVDL
jgi:hypothetical protein